MVVAQLCRTIWCAERSLTYAGAVWEPEGVWAPNPFDGRRRAERGIKAS